MRLGLVDDEIRERVQRLEIPFNRYGLDPFGISREQLALFYALMRPLYRRYLRVESFDIHNVPSRGRALLAGNHSGGLPLDGGMVLSSLFFEMEPPRHAHGMVEKFVSSWPFLATFYDRLGHVTGLPEHATRFLEADRMLLVFPEGVRGVGKLFKDRYRLARFGSGFIRLALQTKSPIVPFAFIGGEEAIPTVVHEKIFARMIGAPYIPIPRQIVPFPLPVQCAVYYGKPIVIEGNGNEPDELIEQYVNRVQVAIEELILRGLSERGLPPPKEGRLMEGKPA